MNDQSRSSLPEGARVLIVLTSALGDVARGIVVPSLLKKLRPDLHITWFVENRWKQIVELCSSVDELLLYDRKAEFWGFPQAGKTLRAAGGFACTLDMQRHAKSGYFSWMSRAPRRVGFSPKDAKEGNWLLQTEYIPQCDFSESKVFHYLSFVEQVLPQEFASFDGQVFFDIDRKRAEGEASSLFAFEDKRYIGLALGSSWESKDWVYPGYVRLIEGLLKEGEKNHVVLLGDSKQVALADRLSQDAGGRVSSLAGKTSLTQLLGVLSLLDVACGPDTGTGHLASLVDTPYVGLFGPTDPARVAPWGAEDLVVTSKVPCRPCGRRVCPGLENACMRLISPEKVRETIIAAGELV